jgi:hypothetical protein
MHKYLYLFLTLFNTLVIISCFLVIFNAHAQTKVHPDLRYAEGESINKKAIGFYGIWADGHGRQPSKSSLYFCDKKGQVYKLPENMSSGHEKPLQNN